VSVNQNIRFRFTPALINAAPADAGVYALWENRELIYYGRAFGGCVTIRSRLREHLGGDIYPCTARATHCSWEISHNPVQRELDLMSEHLESFHDLGEELHEVQHRLAVLEEDHRLLRQRFIHFQRAVATAMQSSGRLIRFIWLPDSLTVVATPAYLSP
jgi:hypothetical protein